MDNTVLYDVKSAILGHAVGDALGVPVEFYNRTVLEGKPVTDMIGYGTHAMPVGTWSDDTSMTLATLDSLTNGIDYTDIMNNFCLWFQHAYYTATGVVFDIGNTTIGALHSYLGGNKEALECGKKGERDNGNGSLMRMIPLILYLHYSKKKDSYTVEKLNYIHKASRLTHAHVISQLGCGIYALVLWELLKDKSKKSIYKGLEIASDIYKNAPSIDKYKRVLCGDMAQIAEIGIKSDDYIVHTLEAALWCVLTTDNYKACVLKAVNLGEDTDTTAAVAGSLAGVLYGYDNIPNEWLSKLIKQDYIEQLCKDSVESW